MKKRFIKFFTLLLSIVVALPTFAACVPEGNHVCVFDQEKKSAAYLKEGLCCGDFAEYYYSCVCGQKGEEIFGTSDIVDHLSSLIWQKDNDYHWKKCQRPNCEYNFEKQEHSFNSKNKCTVCRFVKPEIEEETKTVLKVGVQSFAFGHQWAEEIAEYFEAFYADYSFEQGKTGVKVEITQYNEPIRTQQILNMEENVMFTLHVPYQELVSMGMAEDITDVLCDTDADGERIEDKLYDQFKARSFDGRYYALPFFESLDGIVYDKELFEEENLYFADDWGNIRFVEDEYETKAAGPDGEYDTYDDGLPATYEEFFILAEEMNSKDISPFVWASAYEDVYLQFLLNALYADFAGQEQMYLNINYNGEAKDVITGINGDTITTEFLGIDSYNGYKLLLNQGRYNAISFLEKIIVNQYYDSDCENMIIDHFQAQMKFVSSKYEQTKPCAMLVEGSYWQNEAKDYGAFEQINMYYGEDCMERFGFMPLPKANQDKVGETRTLYNSLGNAMAFINAHATREEHMQIVAKEFLKFCYTDESLSRITETTGATMALNYELQMDTYENLSSYTRSLWDAKNSSDIFSAAPWGNYTNLTTFTLGNESWRYQGRSVVRLLKEGVGAREIFLNIANEAQIKWQDYIRYL